MANLLRWYSKVLYSHPWKTQVLTTGFLMGTSDVIAQTLIERKKLKQVEIHRVARYAFIGVSFVGPTLCIWYKFLERFGTIGKTVVLKKMVADQVAFVPFFLTGFLTISGLVQFQPWIVIKEKISEDYLTILKNNYKLWPAAQLINFYIIPFQYRVFFANCVALIWNTYLASVANQNFIQSADKEELVV